MKQKADFDAAGFVLIWHSNVAAAQDLDCGRAWMPTGRLRRTHTKWNGSITRLPADVEVGLRGRKGDRAEVAYGDNRGWLPPDNHCGTAAATCNKHTAQ